MESPSNTRRGFLIGLGTAATVGTAGVAAARDGDGASLRVAHASPNAPNVDVFVNDTEVRSGVPFRAVNEYLEVPPGEYDVELRAAASGAEVESADVTLEGGATYTIFAEGYLTPDDEPADEPLELVPVQDRSAPPRGPK